MGEGRSGAARRESRGWGRVTRGAGPRRGSPPSPSGERQRTSPKRKDGGSDGKTFVSVHVRSQPRQSTHLPGEEVTAPKQSTARNTWKGRARAAGPATCLRTGTHGRTLPRDPANARTHGRTPNPWILSINRNTENTCRKVGEPSQRGPLCRPQETRDPGESAGLKTIHTRVLGGDAKKKGVRTLRIRR